LVCFGSAAVVAVGVVESVLAGVEVVAAAGGVGVGLGVLATGVVELAELEPEP
jgi:glycerol uptake facilitator-like aquaporin